MPSDIGGNYTAFPDWLRSSREWFSKTAYGKTPKESLPDLAPYTTFDYFSLTGLTALMIYFAAPARSASLGGRSWAVVATLFIYMAIDDGVQIHERLGSAFYRFSRTSGSVFEHFPSYPWQLLFVPVFGLLGLYVFVFLWRELREAGLRWIVIAALSLQAFAVGLDFIEGLMPGHPWNIYRLIAECPDAGVWIPEDARAPAFVIVRHFGKACEETVEMLAITLFWYVFLRHLGASNSGVRLAFVSAR